MSDINSIVASIVAPFLIVFGSVGIVGILTGYIIIHQMFIKNLIDSLDGLSEATGALNSTVRSASDFLGTSTDILDGISKIFYDIGGSLPLVGRSFRDMGNSLGGISTNMHGFRQNIDNFESKWGGSLEKIGILKKGGKSTIRILIGIIMAWLIGLHLSLILIGLALL